MNLTHPTAQSSAGPRVSTLDRPSLMRLAVTEYDRFGDLLAALSASDWGQQTECPGWDVRAMACHALGMVDMAATIREGRRQLRVAKKRGGVFIDDLTALQIEERAELSAQQITQQYRAQGRRAAKARRRTPGLVRRTKMPVQQRVGGQLETWTVGYLVDTILTRDPWMHRIDISRATGRPLVLSTDHDGVLVADIVTEWAARHGQPYRLRLTGVAGGSWMAGEGGPTIELDAVEFCRTVSRREPGADLLGVEVAF